MGYHVAHRGSEPLIRMFNQYKHYRIVCQIIYMYTICIQYTYRLLQQSKGQSFEGYSDMPDNARLIPD